MENVKLFLSQKSQFHLVEKMKNRDKKRTRTSLFQSSEDGKQENFFMWPKCDLQVPCFGELRQYAVYEMSISFSMSHFQWVELKVIFEILG